MQLIPTLCSPYQAGFALCFLCSISASVSTVPLLPCQAQLVSVICDPLKTIVGAGVPQSRTQTSHAVMWASGPHATPISIMPGREKELAEKKAKAVDTAVAMQDCWNDLKWLFWGGSIMQGNSRVRILQQAVSCNSSLYALWFGKTANYISFTLYCNSFVSRNKIHVQRRKGLSMPLQPFGWAGLCKPGVLSMEVFSEVSELLCV